MKTEEESIQWGRRWNGASLPDRAKALSVLAEEIGGEKGKMLEQFADMARRDEKDRKHAAECRYMVLTRHDDSYGY